MTINTQQIIDTKLASTISLCETIFVAKTATRELLTMHETPQNFSTFLCSLGHWPNKRSIQGQDSDKPCGWQVLLKWCETHPADGRSQRWEMFSRSFAAMTDMSARDKKAVKEAKELEEKERQEQLALEQAEQEEMNELAGIVKPSVINAIAPGDCPATSIFDQDAPAYTFPAIERKTINLDVVKNVLANILADDKCDKQTMLEALSFIQELLA